MSRYPTEKEFNKKEFAELLKKAQGNRTQLQFSQDIGMSESYLSCYIGEKKDTPLKPSTLKKIAKASQNGVTLANLLDACGYHEIYNIHLSPLDEVLDETNDRYFNKEVIYKNIISSALADKGYTWQGNSNSEVDPSAEFDIVVYNSAIKDWHFIYQREDMIDSGYDTANLPSYLLNKIAPYSKVSLVTHIENLFNLSKRIRYPALLMYLSIILINKDTLKVEKEFTIPTACEDSDEIPKII